jgi:hypothetical protein
VAAVLVRDAMAAATVDTTRRVLQVLMAEAVAAVVVVEQVLLVVPVERELLLFVMHCQVFRYLIFMQRTT